MNTDQIAKKFSKLSSNQIQQFVENYADMLVGDPMQPAVCHFLNWHPAPDSAPILPLY